MRIPQDTVAVDVNYWNAEHQAALSQYPAAQRIDQICGTTVQIHTAQLLTYTLFKSKDEGIQGWSTYQELAARANGFDTNFDGILEFDGATICGAIGRTNVPYEHIERMGEAVGLSVVNMIHDLHGADWGRIPTQMNPNTRKQAPIFDYEMAADAQNIVHIEAKGSYDLRQNATKQADKINAKKDSIRNIAGYPRPAAVLYGTVSLIPSHGNGNLKCWLLDPPPPEIQLSPNRVKLIHRMRFLSRIISSIGPRTQFATALANRLGDLEELRDIEELDGMPLLSARGEQFKFVKESDKSLYSWFTARSTVKDNLVGGVVVETNDGRLFFVGIRQELLDLAQEQSHVAIRNYGFSAMSSSETVNCVISTGRAKKMKARPAEEKSDDGYIRFNASGTLLWSEEGLVFGWLDTE